jgi:hypothetical protein
MSLAFGFSLTNLSACKQYKLCWSKKISTNSEENLVIKITGVGGTTVENPAQLKLLLLPCSSL